MRQEAKDFVASVLEKHTGLDPVHEFGSLQVEGQEGFADLRPLFPGREYVGCDMRRGTGVDRIEDLHDLSLADRSVGTAVLIDTLEHVRNPFRAVAELRRVLKPGGLLVVASVMNYPVHDYPSDYWRFTPEGFRHLLSAFEESEVSWDGDDAFPTGVYGWGRKTAGEERGFERYDRIVPLGDDDDSTAWQVRTVGPGKTVLDVGCSTGYVAARLKENGCRVTGIEIDPAAAARAEEHCERVVVGDVEALDLAEALAGRRFDVILCGDVLEHLVRPERLLASLRSLVAEGGRLVTSIPNVAYAAVRLDLLAGRFEYEDTGVLDRTHLRFFTLASAVRMLTDSGWYPESLESICRGLPDETVRRVLSQAGIADEQGEAERILSRPDSLAQQYLIVCRTARPSPVDHARLLFQLEGSENQAGRTVRDALDSASEMRVYKKSYEHIMGKPLVRAYRWLKKTLGRAARRGG